MTPGARDNHRRQETTVTRHGRESRKQENLRPRDSNRNRCRRDPELEEAPVRLVKRCVIHGSRDSELRALHKSCEGTFCTNACFISIDEVFHSLAINFDESFVKVLNNFHTSSFRYYDDIKSNLN